MKRRGEDVEERKNAGLDERKEEGLDDRKKRVQGEMKDVLVKVWNRIEEKERERAWERRRTKGQEE